jgi:hypothetical protein
MLVPACRWLYRSAVDHVVDEPLDPATLDAGERPSPARSAADERMRSLLRIGPATPKLEEPAAQRAFSRSILISALRCVLTYVVLPFVAPALGWASGIGPIPGLAVGVVAIWFNVKSIRRFWLAEHRWRWAYTVVGLSVIGLLLVLMVEDLVDLFG